jgi:hypothetical protein
LGIFSGKIIFICEMGKSAELVGTKSLHLLRRPLCRLKAPLGLSLLRKRGFSHFAFSRK